MGMQIITAFPCSDLVTHSGLGPSIRKIVKLQFFSFNFTLYNPLMHNVAKWSDKL